MEKELGWSFLVHSGADQLLADDDKWLKKNKDVKNLLWIH